MAEESFQERTEKATPRKREEAKKRGQIARSPEVNSAAVLIMSMIALQFFAGPLFEKWAGLAEYVFMHLSGIAITVENVPKLTIQGMGFIASVIGPIVLLIMVGGVGANVMQGGLVFAAEPLNPKLEKISPMRGFKRIFSIRSLIEVVKGLMKLIIVGFVGYLTIRGELHNFPFLIDNSVAEIFAFIAGVAFKLLLRVGIVLVVLAALDFAYQKYEHEKKLRMTKQEIKEEYKRIEGDPQVKARIRSIQMKQARQRMLADVPDSTVVVTNPTHLAVALAYDPEEGDAPVVVAKGARLIAEKIKEIARENKVPVIENKPLARTLFKTAKIGDSIPEELYKAVAELLAYVYQLNNNKGLMASRTGGRQ